MAIVRIQAVPANAISGTSAAATWGSTTTAGNLLVAILSLGSATASITPPSGWSHVTIPNVSTAGASPRVEIYYIANASARSGSESFTITSTNMHHEHREYYGCDTAPLDVATSAFSDVATSPATTGTTAAVASTSGLAVGVLNSPSGASAFQGVPNNGFTSVNHTTQASGNIEIQTLEKIGSLTSGGEGSSATLSTSKRYSGAVVIFKPTGVGSPPANSVAPAVTGTPQIGQTLTTSNGTWTNTPTSYTYQWQGDGSNISGATSSTYVLVSADIAHSITCLVTAINASGSASQASNALTAYLIIRIQASSVATGNAVTSIAPSWGSSTAVGNLLVALVTSSQFNVNSITITPPTGWSLLQVPQTTDGPTTQIFYIANAASRSGSEAFAISGTNDAAAQLIEYNAPSGYTWALDQHDIAWNSSGSTTAQLSTNGVATNKANEVWIGIQSVRNASTTVGAQGGSYSSLGTFSTSSGSTSAQIKGQFVEQIRSATGTIDATSTLGTSRQWAGTVASFVPQNPVPARNRIEFGAIVLSPSGLTSLQSKGSALISKLGGRYPKYWTRYVDWPNTMMPSGNPYDNQVVSWGATPVVGWAPNITCAAVVDGTHDTYINTSAAAALAFGSTIYMRFAYEFNLSTATNAYGVKNQPTGNSYAQFVTMWQYVYNKFQTAGATNVKWVWNPNADQDGTIPFDACYPGDSYVDIVALDGYNQDNVAAGKNPWQTPWGVFSKSIADITALAPSKPLWLAEVGGAANDGPNKKALWFTHFFANALITSFPNVTAIHYFDDSDANDYTVDTSGADTAALTALNTATANNFFFTNPTGGYLLLEDGSGYYLLEDGSGYLVLENVAAAKPTNVSAPVISGSTVAPALLSSTPGTWSG